MDVSIRSFIINAPFPICAAPFCNNNSVFGFIPTLKITKSVFTVFPSLTFTPSILQFSSNSNSETNPDVITSIPFSFKTASAKFPNFCCHIFKIWLSPSIKVTSFPASRKFSATSIPINPAPITVICLEPEAKPSFVILSKSTIERHVDQLVAFSIFFIGGTIDLAPVAKTNLS